MKKILCLFTVLAASARIFGAVPPPEKLLPDDTLALVTAPDYSKLTAAYSSSPQTQLWNDPALQAFRKKFTDKLTANLITPLERDLGIHLSNYTTLPQGQVTLAIIQNGWDGKPGNTNTPGFLILVDTRDKSAQLKSNLSDLRKKWADANKPVKTEKIRDVEFSALTISPEDLPKTLRPATPPDANDEKKPGDAASAASRATLYVGQADSLLVIADSPKSIEKVLAALSGGAAPTVSEVPSFAATRDSLFRDSPVFGWVNLRVLVATLKQSLPPVPASDTTTPPPEKIISALGLDGLRSAAFATQFRDDGAEFDLQLGVPEDARAGIFKLLAGESKDVSAPAFVPAEAVKFNRYRIDGAKTWEGLRKIIGGISAQSLGGLDFVIDSAEANAREKNPDFDIKKDLFANLGDDFISWSKSPKGDSLAELTSAPSILLIGSPDATRLQNAVNALMAVAGATAPPKDREFLGKKIYSVSVPMLALAAPAAGGPGASTPPSLNYAASGGYLAISLDPSMVEEFIRSGSSDTAKSLSDTPGLAAAREKISGPGTSFFSYENDGDLMRTYLKLLKSDAGASAIDSYFAMIMMVSGGSADFSFKDWVDVSLLPNFDQISKYFSFTVSAAGATPDGLVLKAYSPVPPQLRK